MDYYSAYGIVVFPLAFLNPKKTSKNPKKSKTGAPIPPSAVNRDQLKVLKLA